MAHYTMPISKPQKCSATGPHVSKLVDLAPPTPAAKDWRNETCGETSCVSGVKNQGKCGSCWTFSTVGAMEAVHAINTGTMTLFSEQQVRHMTSTLLRKLACPFAVACALSPRVLPRS